MSEISLIPIRVRRKWNPSTQTLGRPMMATCDDGLDYCIKDDKGGVPVRASEWLCTKLATAAGIAVPTPAVVLDLDRKTALFGSQICGDDTNDNFGLFQSGALTPDHVRHIMKTFIFDLFVCNTDRHVNQYKIFEQNHSSRIVSFDFGEALFFNWPAMPIPLDSRCNTIQNIRAMINLYGKMDGNVAAQVLDDLAKIDGSAIVSAVKALPRGWLDRRLGGEFTSWFGGRGRRDRIEAIREGVRNGSCV